MARVSLDSLQHVSVVLFHQIVFVSLICLNRLFGSRYERERYYATLQACALVPDLAVLPDSDATYIGERGVSLSGK